MTRTPEGYVEEWYVLRAATVAAFHSQRGRLPMPKDGKLGAWLSSQRSAANRGLTSMTPERIGLLDQLAPGWREHLPQPNTWSHRLEELVTFRANEGRWPSQTAADAAERKLGVWLSNQRQLARKGNLATGKWVDLDLRAPGWDPGPRDEAWLRTAEALGEFRHRHDRWPSKAADDVKERKLGSWLHNRRQDARTGAGWTPERAAHLDRVASGWNG